ncbi:hypothetical protein AB4853_10490 [Bradyrhizobium sp. 1050_B9_N1_2]|uniref:hypothetical protein n=1 Tax=Bradyrhizobium sp. 1050_B9_N1_2 TaxID=3238688 RepID=UPI003EDC603F
MTGKRPDRELEAELEAMVADLAEACKGLCPLESALLIAHGMREVYGGAWAIEAHSNGAFSILRKT